MAVCMGRKKAISPAVSTASLRHGGAGDVGLRDLVAFGAQPRGGRGQAERLAAHFVRGDQEDPHTLHYGGDLVD